MKMYPKHNLYKEYNKNWIDQQFSRALPDVTKKITLENMNYAINLTDKWNVCMDIGGGSGHYLAALASKFKKSVLVEAQYLPEQEIYKNNISNFEIFNTYIEKYTSTEKIDFILLADLFEHIPDIKNFVAKLSSFQEIGGVVYIMTPNPVYCGPAPESGLYYKINKDGHIKQYARHEIVNLMKLNGYTLVLSFFEEAPFRQKAKAVIFALSRRDKNWSKRSWYILFRPIFLVLSLPITWLLGKITHYSELNNRQNEFVTMTQDLVFKKIDEN